MSTADLEKEFPKLMELHRSYEGSDSEHFLKRIPDELNHSPEKLQSYEDILQELSVESFSIIKTKLLPLRKIPLWEYAPSFDILSELFGYRYLVDEGYAHVEFLPEDKKERTPDLAAMENGELACLLEVKCIHTSMDDEIKWFTDQQSGNVEQGIPDGLKKKIVDSICDARQQIYEYTKSNDVQKIVYLLIELDMNRRADPANWARLTQFLKENKRVHKPHLKVEWKFRILGGDP